MTRDRRRTRRSAGRRAGRDNAAPSSEWAGRGILLTILIGILLGRVATSIVPLSFRDAFDLLLIGAIALLVALSYRRRMREAVMRRRRQ